MLSTIGGFAAKIFGSSNDRRVKGYNPRVEAINLLEEDVARLTDDELKLRTENFRRQLAEGATVDDLLVPAFATVREAAKRTLGQRHFDVQLIGGMVLHEGKIAEMKTGEGKTLVATLPVYLNALAGKGVHVVTVNDYLAQRDADWMGQIYTFLGLTVGKIVHGIDDEQRKAAYACDVTYGTNNELGFDYLRDNMKMDMDEMVQRGHSFAIVDEVDSILIDEARTPLIISGPLEDRADLYQAVDEIIPTLGAEDFELDEKQRQVSLTEAGNERVEVMLAERGLMKGSLYDIENVSLVHHINSALKAHKLFQRDRDYIVKGGEVVIIDEFTGRMMPGRRYSEGLHQALEAKERVEIQPENQTLASITFQNYFRLYKKLAGMTGTASTEANEFLDIYGLDVLEIPTNVAVGRVDDDDEIYRTAKEKYAAIVQTIADCHRRNQPILVGTVSIEKSEQLSDASEGQEVHPGAGPQRARPGRQAEGGQGRRAQGVSRRHGLLPGRARLALQGQRRPGAASGAQCPPPRAGGAHRRAGRRAGRGDHRHQHGRPRHRHSARRQRRSATEGLDRRRDRGRPRARRRRRSPRRASASSPTSPRRSSRRSKRAASMCSPPSATRAAASTTSCAAAPAARATRAAPSSTWRSTTT